MPDCVNIFVGCGGSGIKTLKQVNRLMAEDPSWRNRLARDVYYLLIDTSGSDIDEFEESIRAQMGKADPPVVRSIRLAQNRTLLQPLVQRCFVTPFEKEPDERAKARLAEHWWVNKDGPFFAPKVRPLTKGAGQCPPVSYFLTWYDLHHISAVFEELVGQVIPMRRAGLGCDPHDEMNFCIIAGLAGGTGRGSWTLVALKLRELLLEQYEVAPRPVAFLFDATTFKNRFQKNPRQEMPMRVNALTGISELSCWIKNVRSGKPRHKYQLPNMRSPGDQATDLLDVDLSLDVEAAAPVDNAYLIFDTGGRTVLDSHDQYHEMVGSAIYAGVTRASLQARQINEDPPFKGLAAATFEVNAVTLRRYFEYQYRMKALQQLLSVDESTVSANTDAFFKRTSLRIAVTAQDVREYRAEEKGTLLQRTCFKLLGWYEDGMKSLEDTLARDEPDEVKQAVAELVQPNPTAAKTAVLNALQQMGATPAQVARDMVGSLCRKSRSVAEVMRFVEQVIAQMKQEEEQLPSAEAMRATFKSSEDPLELVEQYKGREFVVAGRRFNDEEAGEISDKTRMAILYANYGPIAEELKKQYAAWRQNIEALYSNAAILKQQCDKILAKFGDEVRKNLGDPGMSAEDLFEMLFTDAEYPERSIPNEFSPVRFYKRVLKPVLKRREQTSILPEVQWKQELDQLISNTLMNERLGGDTRSQIETLSRDLENAIRNTVHLSLEFVVDRFSIVKVIEELRHAWKERLNREGDQDLSFDLREKFKNFFGVDPQRDGQEWRLPSTREEFMAAMGASLASTCRPFWRLNRDADEDLVEQDRVSLFLPVTSKQIDPERVEKRIKELSRDSRLDVEVLTEDRSASEEHVGGANPFLILAYAVEGTSQIEHIASLNYWNESPGLYRTLQQCEDKNGSAIFDQQAAHNGLGYTDPLYVKNEELAKMRWKPWVDKRPEAQMEKAKSLDAISYALLRPSAALQERLEKEGWKLPLLQDAGKEVYKFSRRAMIVRDGKAEEDGTSPWPAGRKVCQSIWQVRDVFEGKGNTAQRLIKEGPEWRDRILQEARIFWDMIGRKLGFSPGSELYKELLKEHEANLSGLSSSNKKDAEDQKVWKALLERVGMMRDGKIVP